MPSPALAPTSCAPRNGQLLSERSAAGTFYYLGDALGSVMALANSAGSVVNTYAYEPYGALTASTGSTANPFGYGGQYLDSATGLYKMGQRYYDPALARWGAQDLLAGGLSSPQSFDRYASVLGNPTSAIDARGLCIPQGTYGPWTWLMVLALGGYCQTPILPITATTPDQGTATLQGVQQAGPSVGAAWSAFVTKSSEPCHAVANLLTYASGFPDVPWLYWGLAAANVAVNYIC